MGYLWAEDYGRPGDAERVWSVFHPEGKLVGRVSIPSGYRVLEIGIGHVLGWNTDPRGGDMVSVFPLTRPGG
ncbi:hypothetical protein ACFL0I_04140 [Gemmatimonadota bacterium]